jgi:hypothetical protein
MFEILVFGRCGKNANGKNDYGASQTEIEHLGIHSSPRNNYTVTDLLVSCRSGKAELTSKFISLDGA